MNLLPRLLPDNRELFHEFYIQIFFYQSVLLIWFFGGFLVIRIWKKNLKHLCPKDRNGLLMFVLQ